jgi:hypothetical protein
MKPDVSRRRTREHAVEHQRVHVDIEVHRTTESLDDGDAATAGTRHALVPHPPAEVSLDGAVKNAHDRSAAIVPPGEHIAQTTRQREDPLPYRNIRQHVVDEMRRAFGHTPAAAARTEAAALAGEGDETFRVASPASEAREAAREEPAPQERAGVVAARKWFARVTSRVTSHREKKQTSEKEREPR